jgi:GT2 family glycosyltransferase
MAPPHAPQVSVVIVCWNSAGHLPRCLRALESQTFRDFEVIVVDNASTDGTTADLAARFPNLRLNLQSLDANRGFAAANNIGAMLARADWLALLNPDAFPEPSWLEHLVRAASARPASFFASRQIQAQRPELLDGEGDDYHVSGLAWRRNYGLSTYPAGPPVSVFSACAAAALYPRKEFIAAGGFDEDYFAYHEDVDLGFRLRLRGLRCFLVPDAVVHHVGAASSGIRSGFAVYHGHRNLVWTYAKDMPAPWFWLYLPLHLGTNLVALLYFLLVGHGVSIVRAKIDALRGLPRALRKRSQVQAQRRVSGSEVLRNMNTDPFGPLQGWMSRHSPEIR